MSDSSDPMDCSLPGSSVHMILLARILECVAISFSRGSSQPRNLTQSPALQADSLPTELQGKTPISDYWDSNVLATSMGEITFASQFPHL